MQGKLRACLTSRTSFCAHVITLPPMSTPRPLDQGRDWAAVSTPRRREQGQMVKGRRLAGAASPWLPPHCRLRDERSENSRSNTLQCSAMQRVACPHLCSLRDQWPFSKNFIAMLYFFLFFIFFAVLRYSVFAFRSLCALIYGDIFYFKCFENIRNNCFVGKHPK